MLIHASRGGTSGTRARRSCTPFGGRGKKVDLSCLRMTTMTWRRSGEKHSNDLCKPIITDSGKELGARKPPSRGRNQ